MKKITIKTSKGSVSWGISNLKYLVGNNIEWKYEVMSVLMAHFSKTGLSEYDEEKFLDWRVHINDGRSYAKNYFFVQINQHYDYEAHAKMTAHSILTTYIAELSRDLPHSDEYEIYENIYKSLINRHALEKLNISTEDVNIKFDSVPITTKIFQKFIKPHLEKENLEASSFDLSLSESIELQCSIIKKLSFGIKKEVVVLYDGPVTSKVQKSIERLTDNSKNIMCIVNVQGNHIISELNVQKYVLMGDEFVDLSNIYEIADKIQMEMPYAGDRESFIEDLCMYSTGDITDRNSYLCRFFGYKCV